MFVLAPLALLASLLSSFALPFVDAAYLPGRRPETQNVHRFSPAISPPRFGVSGRHHTDNERAHNKVPKSVFSRHRYLRDTGTLTRRSSVYVLGEHGDTFLVSRSGEGAKGQKTRSRVHGRRQSNQVVGRVDVMGTVQSSGSSQRLASLAVDSTPTNLTPGQNATKVFGVNASTTNRTQFIMMALDEPSDTMSSHKHVSLAVQVFDAERAETVMYCAMYDPDPAATSALVMAPCATQSVASAPVAALDHATDATPSSNPHQRQIFSYDPFSGQIQPMASITSTDTPGQDTHCGSEERRDIGNSTTSSSATASNTQPSAAPTPVPLQHAQTVTLVYVPEALEVPVSSRSLGATDASQGQVEAVMTTTITTTVVTTVTASASSSKSPTPLQAAASVSTPTPTTTATPTPTRPSTPSASASATASPRSSSVPNESLEIEIIGVTPTTTARSSSASSTTTTHVSTSPTLDAQAVASSIANSRSSKSQSSSSPTATATPVVVAVSGRSRIFGRM